MTLTARLEAAIALMEAVGSINTPVRNDELRWLLQIAKEKEAK